jgi:hypothetical protein
LLGDNLLTRVAWIEADFHTKRNADPVLLAEVLTELSHSVDVQICSKKLTFTASHQFLGGWSALCGSSDMKKLAETAARSRQRKSCLVSQMLFN